MIPAGAASSNCERKVTMTAVAAGRYECQVCGGAAGGAGEPVRCEGCRALFYCNEQHRAWHAAQAGGHDRAECARMRLQVAREAALRAELPFAFSATEQQPLGGVAPQPRPAGPSPSYPAVQEGGGVCAFLEALGIHGRGPFRAECQCWERLLAGAAAGQAGGGDECARAFRAERERGNPIDSWRALEAAAGLPEPAAALHLHWTLTAFLCCEQSGASAGATDVTVHLVGASRREVAQVRPGLLAALLGARRLHLAFVGPAVPPSAAVDGGDDRGATWRLTFHRDLYHDVLARGDLPAPTVNSAKFGTTVHRFTDPKFRAAGRPRPERRAGGVPGVARLGPGGGGSERGALLHRPVRGGRPPRARAPPARGGRGPGERGRRAVRGVGRGPQPVPAAAAPAQRRPRPPHLLQRFPPRGATRALKDWASKVGRGVRRGLSLMLKLNGPG